MPRFDPNKLKWFDDSGNQEPSSFTPSAEDLAANHDAITQSNTMEGGHRNGQLGRGASAPTPTEQVQANVPVAGNFDPQALYNDQYGREQQTALDALQREVQYGGWTPEEKTAYQRQSAQSAGIAAGQRAGLAQQMISKGMPASVANQMSGEIGQQQESQTGYLMGTAAQQMANQRAYDAATAMSGLASGMQGQSMNEREFNAAQGQRGVLEEYQALTGQNADIQSRSDAMQAQNMQNVTTAVNGGLGLAETLTQMGKRSGGSSGSGGGSGYTAPDWSAESRASAAAPDDMSGMDWGS